MQTHLRASGNGVRFEGINDAALITILVGGEVQGVTFGGEVSEGSRGFTPSTPGLAAATVWLVPGTAEVGTTQDLEAGDPSSVIGSSVTLEVISLVQPSLPQRQAVSQPALSTDHVCFCGSEPPPEATLRAPRRFALKSPGQVCHLLKRSVFVNM